MLKNTIGESKKIIILGLCPGKQNLHRKEGDIPGGTFMAEENAKRSPREPRVGLRPLVRQDDPRRLSFYKDKGRAGPEPGGQWAAESHFVMKSKRLRSKSASTTCPGV